MSNREALRELQGRLASRMQAARTEARVQSWLAVECAGQGLLFPLHEAGEIFSVGSVLPVPHTQPWFAGVANLRGGLHARGRPGAVSRPAAWAGSDGRRRFARQCAAAGVEPVAGRELRLAGGPPGRSAQRRSIDCRAARRPAPGERPAFAGARWRDADGRLWQEIELSALAGHEQFLGVAG